MALIEWRESYCTGIAGVDFEHQELIAQLNAVFELIAGSSHRDEVIDALDEIYADIASHFALEERIMKKGQYDQYLEHKADHDRLLDQIREITEEYEKTIKLDRDGFTQQLSDWFQNHFSTHDARLHKISHPVNNQGQSQSGIKTIMRDFVNKFLKS